MNKYEQLIEYIINDEQDKAKALFHTIVVEKSRDIYENIMDEENYEEGVGGNQVHGLADEVMADEEGMHEAEADDEMSDELGGDDMGGDDMGGDDMGMGSEEAPIEDRVMDLEAAMDELKAEFDALMSDEPGEEGQDDMGMGDEMGGDDMGGDEEEEVEGMYMEAEEEEDDEEEDDEKDVAESRRAKSEAERIREYVEKVSGGADKTEGGEVGKGGTTPINKQSIMAKKNDMGGTTANIVKGGSEQNPDGKQYKAPSNVYTKGQGTLKGAEKNVNQVGGNKGAQDYYNTKATAKKPEGSTTDGSVSVDKQSILKKIK
jgi:hypothetical protein